MLKYEEFNLVMQTLHKLNHIFKLILISLLFSVYSNSYSFSLKAKENEIEKSVLSQKNNEIINSVDSEYILDSGDQIYIDFSGIEIFSQNYPLNPEGYIHLPEIGRYLASGKTIKELEKELITEYKKYIILPNLDIMVTAYRPVNYYIYGEVKIPGLYSLQYKNTKSNLNKEIDNNLSASVSPKLFDALKSARGITNYADLSKIEIIRKNSKTNGGGKIKTEINMMNLLLKGDFTQNIRILDGDSIFIPKNKNPIKEQIISMNNTNFNPEIITVFITGNVVRQGPIKLKRGSSLVQAIASSGGKKLMTGNVNFIRFDENGISKKETFRYNQNAKLNSKKNPILSDGDVINVQTNVLGKSSAIIGEFANPILSGLGLYRIFN